MARSHKIYIVSYSPFDGVKIAFTVKHEMLTWLRKDIREDEIPRIIKEQSLGWHIESFYDGIEDGTNITDEIDAILVAELKTENVKS